MSRGELEQFEIFARHAMGLRPAQGKHRLFGADRDEPTVRAERKRLGEAEIGRKRCDALALVDIEHLDVAAGRKSQQAPVRAEGRRGRGKRDLLQLGARRDIEQVQARLRRDRKPLSVRHEAKRQYRRSDRARRETRQRRPIGRAQDNEIPKGISHGEPAPVRRIGQRDDGFEVEGIRRRRPPADDEQQQPERQNGPRDSWHVSPTSLLAVRRDCTTNSHLRRRPA